MSGPNKVDLLDVTLVCEDGCGHIPSLLDVEMEKPVFGLG